MQKSTNRNGNPEAEPTRHQFLLAEKHTQLKIQYVVGFADYRLKVAKIRQLNVDEPYLRSNRNKDGIIKYIVDHEWWQIDNGCGGERSDKFAFSANSATLTN